MADTSLAEVPPQTNGISLDGGVDDDERSKMRPADIDADVREMERRKRVEIIMNSKLFREELERIIETQLKDGSSTSGLMQQISDMMGVSKNTAGNVFKNSSCVVPINDIRGIEAMGYGKGEKILRCKLAAVYRLVDLYGWTQGSTALITARLNQDEEHFLVNPYGMLFHEITASSLMKVDMQGNVIEQGTTNFGVNLAAFSLHSAIHAARPDIKCIIHVHTPSVVAISALKCGLLPISQESVVVGEVSTHAYVGSVGEVEEREKIARNLGPNNKVLLLSNRGAVCCGETIEEAFFNARNTVLASESQLKLLPMGVDNLILLDDETRKRMYEAARKAPDSTPRPDQPSVLEAKIERKWRVGGVEFEGLMRMLDNAGFRTGYIYRHPLVKGDPPRPRNDVEVPPAVSSLGYLLEEEELYKQGLWKKLEGGRKGNDRSRWLNSPNVYQKVEILETGTPDPKKITKWVTDDSPTHSSTPVKIDSALQFVPKNTNPKEFKKLQQQIKDYRRSDKISAGPQSHILEGATWEEARRMQDAGVTQTGDQVVLMGAASKGIIQRGFQHNATMYKAPYAKNPFDSVTDEEIDEYRKVVEKKVKGEYDTDFSESEGLSSAQVTKRISDIRSPTSAASETEEESRDEHQVLRIETKHAPKPSQPEVVLSDDITRRNQLPPTGRQSKTNSMRSRCAVRLSCTLSSRLKPKSYRTNSFGGFPRGSYAIPNPKHYHIVQHRDLQLFRRPVLLKLSSDKNRFDTADQAIRVILYPSKACQTSYQPSLALRDEQFRFDSEIDKHLESEMEKSLMRKVHDSLVKDITSTSNYNDSSDSTSLDVTTTDDSRKEQTSSEELDYIRTTLQLCWDCCNEKPASFNSRNSLLEIKTKSLCNFIGDNFKSAVVIAPETIENCIHNPSKVGSGDGSSSSDSEMLLASHIKSSDFPVNNNLVHDCYFMTNQEDDDSSGPSKPTKSEFEYKHWFDKCKAELKERFRLISQKVGSPEKEEENSSTIDHSPQENAMQLKCDKSQSGDLSPMKKMKGLFYIGSEVAQGLECISDDILKDDTKLSSAQENGELKERDVNSAEDNFETKEFSSMKSQLLERNLRVGLDVVFRNSPKRNLKKIFSENRFGFRRENKHKDPKSSEVDTTNKICSDQGSPITEERIEIPLQDKNLLRIDTNDTLQCNLNNDISAEQCKLTEDTRPVAEQPIALISEPTKTKDTAIPEPSQNKSTAPNKKTKKQKQKSKNKSINKTYSKIEEVASTSTANATESNQCNEIMMSLNQAKEQTCSLDVPAKFHFRKTEHFAFASVHGKLVDAAEVVKNKVLVDVAEQSSELFQGILNIAKHQSNSNQALCSNDNIYNNNTDNAEIAPTSNLSDDAKRSISDHPINNNDKESSQHNLSRQTEKSGLAAFLLSKNTSTEPNKTVKCSAMRTSASSINLCETDFACKNKMSSIGGRLRSLEHQILEDIKEQLSIDACGDEVNFTISQSDEESSSMLLDSVSSTVLRTIEETDSDVMNAEDRRDLEKLQEVQSQNFPPQFSFDVSSDGDMYKDLTSLSSVKSSELSYNTPAGSDIDGDANSVEMKTKHVGIDTSTSSHDLQAFESVSSISDNDETEVETITYALLDELMEGVKVVSLSDDKDSESLHLPTLAKNSKPQAALNNCEVKELLQDLAFEENFDDVNAKNKCGEGVNSAEDVMPTSQVAELTEMTRNNAFLGNIPFSYQDPKHNDIQPPVGAERCNKIDTISSTTIQSLTNSDEVETDKCQQLTEPMPVCEKNSILCKSTFCANKTSFEDTSRLDPFDEMIIKEQPPSTHYNTNPVKSNAVLIDENSSGFDLSDSGNDNFEDVLNQMTDLIVQYLLKSRVLLDGLVIFPEVERDENLHKLYGKLENLYREYILNSLSDEQKNELRIKMEDRVLRKINDLEERLALIADFLSKILDQFFSRFNPHAASPDLFNSFRYGIENGHSTPTGGESTKTTNLRQFNQKQRHSIPTSSKDKQASMHVTQKIVKHATVPDLYNLTRDFQYTPLNALQTSEEISCFQAKRVVGGESYWLSINRSPKSEKRQNYIDVDAIRLRSAIESTSTKPSLSTIQEDCNDTAQAKQSTSDEMMWKQTSESCLQISKQTRFRFLKNTQRNLTPICEEPAKTPEGISSLISQGHYVSFERPETNTVLVNEVQFFRSVTTNASSYVMSNNVQFNKSNAVDEKASEEDSSEGNWMGFENAKF